MKENNYLCLRRCSDVFQDKEARYLRLTLRWFRNSESEEDGREGGREGRRKPEGAGGGGGKGRGDQVTSVRNRGI